MVLDRQEEGSFAAVALFSIFPIFSPSAGYRRYSRESSAPLCYAILARYRISSERLDWS